MRKIRVRPRGTNVVGEWNNGFKVQEKNGGGGKQYIVQMS